MGMIYKFRFFIDSRNRLMAALHHHGSQAKGTAMKTLLQIKTSVFSDRGNSTRLANEFVAGWQKSHPDGRVVIRDLASAPLPHLLAARELASLTPGEPRQTEQQDLSPATAKRTNTHK